METLFEVLRIGLTVAFMVGVGWVLLLLHRSYQVDERPTRLIGVLHRVGVDPTGLGEWPLVLYRPLAIRLCHSCPSKAECDAWLAQKGRAAAPPEFCPNATLPQLFAAIPWRRAE